MATPLPLESDPQDVALADDGDILIDEQGLHFVTGLQAIAQLVRIRLLMFLAEWFLNMDIGVPYYEELLGDASKVPGVVDRAHAAFAAQILSVPGITGILQLSITVDSATRKMSVIWAASTMFGDTPPDLLETP